MRIAISAEHHAERYSSQGFAMLRLAEDELRLRLAGQVGMRGSRGARCSRGDLRVGIEFAEGRNDALERITVRRARLNGGRVTEGVAGGNEMRSCGRAQRCEWWRGLCADPRSPGGRTRTARVMGNEERERECAPERARDRSTNRESSFGRTRLSTDCGYCH